MDTEEARQLAQDENTPPEILAELAKSQDYRTRQNVAKNPNTPKEVLLNICMEFPGEVMNNPAIAML